MPSTALIETEGRLEKRRRCGSGRHSLTLGPRKHTFPHRPSSRPGPAGDSAKETDRTGPSVMTPSVHLIETFRHMG
jgi:hypothetical protein